MPGSLGILGRDGKLHLPHRHLEPVCRGFAQDFRFRRAASILGRGTAREVERFFAQLNGFRRLGVRFERFSDIYLGLLHLAAIMICLRRLLQ